MGYSKNALILHELALVTSLDGTELTIVESASSTNAITTANFSKGTNSVLYGFYIDANGDLNVDTINAAGSYDATIYKEWFLGALNITFSINANGELIVTI